MIFFDVHTHQPKENSILNCFPSDETPAQWFSVGIHPWYLEDLETQKRHLLAKSKLDNCKAIGEFGFDRLSGTSLETQNELFDLQFDLAQQLQKPIIIHCVRAFDLLTPKIKHTLVPIIVHGFNQNKEIFSQLLKIENVYFSFGAAILTENSNAQKALKRCPKDRFFLETDDKSEICIKDSYAKTTELLNLSIDRLTEVLTKNIKKVFS